MYLAQIRRGCFPWTGDRYYHTAKLTDQVDDCFAHPEMRAVQEAGHSLEVLIFHVWPCNNKERHTLHKTNFRL